MSLAFGGSTTLKLSTRRRPSLAYNKKVLKAKAGKVTIVMTEHVVDLPARRRDQGQGQGPKKGKTVGKGGISKVTLTLKPGTYTFYCTVPGHEAAGMKGKLVVTK